MALILREASTASLSAMLGSSAADILAERMTHMSLRFTLTAYRYSHNLQPIEQHLTLKSALLMGDPCRTDILGRVARVSHSLST